MINLEVDGKAIVLLEDETLEKIRKRGSVAILALGSPYPLSDEQAATAFEVLRPEEARVPEPLRQKIAKAKVVLIRWIDGTESLAALPPGQDLPSPSLLQSAYRNGYAAKRLGVLVAKRDEGSHD